MSIAQISETKHTLFPELQEEKDIDIRPKPFLKWVGGKGQLLSQFAAFFHIHVIITMNHL